MAATIVTAMVSGLATSLRQAPATVTALAALALFVVWATDDAGYPVTHWAPGGLVIAALLALCVGIVGVRWGELSAPVRLALGCLAAYTALSFLSILWAGVPGDAWEGANRTLLYLLVFAFIPARLRTFAALAPVAAAIAATAPAVLRVGNHLDDDRVNPATLHSAILAIFLAACAVGLVFAAAAAIEQRHAFSERAVGRTRAALTVCAIAALVALIAGGWVAAGDPAARIHHGWETFKSVRGYGANGAGGRLTSGLGSNRYDFYRVALNEFAAHPVAGIGADNFQQQYLRHGRSVETPRYPHSVDLRTLAHTGVIGALLALAG